MLKEELLAIAEEVSKEEVEKLRRCVEVHKINWNDSSVDKMLS